MAHYVILVEQIVNEGAMDGYLDAILENAQASRLEPGCVRFDVLQPDDAPDTVLLYEIYEDEAAFKAHQQTPHYAVFDERRKPLLKSGRRRNLRWSNPL